MAARAVTLYRLLLRLFPPAFRARFGDEMTQVFADRLSAARHQGRSAVLAFWCRTGLDIVTHAAAERRQVRRVGPPARSSLMRHLIEDLSAAARAHVRRPAFALMSAAMLAIGLGFNTGLFAVVKGVLLTPLPFPEPDRLVMLWTGRNPDGTGSVNAYADWLDWRERSRSFASLATYNISFTTLADGGEPQEVHGASVSPEFFGVLHARFLLGRGVQAGDERVALDNARPVVISAALWRRRFSADPGLLNHTITLGNRPRQVVGIVSDDFVHPEPFWDLHVDYWQPLDVSDSMRTNHANHFLRVIGRLRPGVTIEQARAEMDGIGRTLMQEYPRTNPASVVVDRLQDDLVGDTRPLALMFFGAATLVLLLAVANIVNLLLARANRRRSEFAIRAALGASRRRLVSQLVAESTLVGLAGGLAGVGLAKLGLRFVVSIAPSNVLGLDRVGLDGATLAFATVLSAATGALCGVLPAWRVSRARLASSLGEARGSTGLEVSRARTWLIAAEVALALPLLVGAGLLTKTLVHMQRVDLGFDPAHALQFRVSLSGARYGDAKALTAFYDDLTRRLLAVPGVRAAGAISSLPLGGLNNTGGSIAYARADGSEAELGVGFRSAIAGYFAAMRIPLLRGRLFSAAPEDNDTVVVNDQAARAMWGDVDPLGKRIRFGAAAGRSNQNPWLTVVGVVGSTRHDAVTRPPNAEIFQPYQSNPWSTMTVVAGTDGDPEPLAPAARAIVRDLDPRIALVGLGPASTFLDGQLERPRVGVVAAVVMGMVGLLLAGFGTFAVLSLLVAQRTREIGIRMALGASTRSVGGMLVRESMLPMLAGCTAGALAASALAQTLSRELFGVTARDPLAFAAAIGVLVGSAALAIWRPARRAMKVDPVRALRAE